MKFGIHSGSSVTSEHGGNDLEDHLQTVLNSPGFQKTPALRSLLVYLWEHRGETISEYALATEGLGKSPDFEPKLDATVRVRISRLRLKLKEFYDTDGADSPIQISIPLGGHEVEIERKPSKAAPPIPSRWNPVTRALCVLCVALAILGVSLYIENRRLRANSQSNAAGIALPTFWRNFFGNGKPASVFLPTPVFFEWDRATLKARDPLVNDFQDYPKSAELARLVERLGKPKLLQNYTVASDTFAALKLAQFLQVKQISISIAGTADLSIDAAGDQNIILIGVPGTSRQLNEILTRTNFYCNLGASSIVLNRKPLPGEPTEYRAVTQSSIRRTSPGMVSVLPGKVPGTRLLVITGNATYPLVYSLVTPVALRSIEAAWQRAGSPEFFEMVVNADLEGRNTVLRTWPEAVRPVSISDWK